MTTLSIQPPYPLITDIDGQPLEDGYIWIGVANLPPIGNPVSVYWDAALTQPAALPVRTRGGYPVNAGTPARLYVGSDYSILVQNKNGSTIYSAPAATERYSDPVITGVSSAEVSFLQAGTGAVTRTAQSKLRDVVSVFDFMTSAQIADVQSNAYSVDVSGAVQAAIDANATNGAYLWFPKGTYRFNSGVTLPVNATAKWVFDAPLGTIIRTSSAITLLSRNPSDQTNALNTIANNTLTIRNLTFQGSGSSGQVGVSIGSTYGALVDNCYFVSLDKGLIFRFGLKAVIRNCFFTDNVTESIVLRHGDWAGASVINSQSNSSTVQSCRIYNRAGATSSIAVIATSDVSIRDSIIEGFNPVYGVFFDTLAAPVVKNIVIDVCHLECIPTASAFYFKGTGGTATVRSVFAQGTLSAGAYLIDNSQFHGSPMNVHVSDMPNIIGANPAGYVFRTAYPSQWSFDGDFGELVASGAVKSSLFESVNSPLEPSVIVTGGNSTGGPSVGVRTYGGLGLYASGGMSLSSGSGLTISSGGNPLRLQRGASCRIDVNLGSNDIDLVCNILRINGTQGSTGTFTTADGKTVTVTMGLITSIV